jgi:hypothetical protein
MRPRIRLFIACSSAILTMASSLAAAPGVYPTELPPTSIAPSNVVLPQSSESPFRHDGVISVVQRFGVDNTPVAVPICFFGKSVGHAYAVKSGTLFRSICRTSSGSSQTPVVGSLVRPTGQQASSVYWVPFQKGGALPRTIAALAVDALGVSVYACKAKVGPSEHVGTLLPNGECQLAPFLLGSTSGRVEASSMVLVRGGSQGADPSPAYGWIYVKAGGHHPGGSLLKWLPSPNVFCRGKIQGTIWVGALETNPDGSIRGCLVSPPGVTMTATEDLAVFRNDTSSNVEFARSAPPTVARVTVGGSVPCVLETNREPKLHLGRMDGDRCRTPTYLQLRNEYLPYYELVRRGAWPDQG